MEIKNVIKVKISQYLSNELSKEDIYNWALGEMYKMLQGGIFEIRNVEVWGIITGLVEIKDIDDIYCDELIHQFNRILMGNENSSFSFFIRIPEKFVMNNLSQIKSILLKYSAKEQLSRTDILTLKLITDKTFNTPSTLNEVLELQILDLLKLGYDFHTNEGIINFDLKHTVFISEDTSIELDYLTKIIALLECYEGKKGFSVHTTFNDGIGNISIQA
ncbi:MAG: hypothetical protein WCP73_04760 [Eubacteriales bacterium]